jgi:hypothetical protein
MRWHIAPTITTMIEEHVRICVGPKSRKTEFKSLLDHSLMGD